MDCECEKIAKIPIVWHCCGYEINVSPLELSDKEFDRYHACVAIVEEEYSLMQIEQNPKYGIPHSTLHYWIHHHLKDLSMELYYAVCGQFKINFERRFKK